MNWHAIDASVSDDVALLLEGMVRSLRPVYVVESGTYLGRSAQVMASSGAAIVHTCDPCQECAQARPSFGALPVATHLCRLDEFTPSAPVNFAFIDGGLGERLSDLEYLRPYLHADAVVVIDDAGPEIPGDGFQWVRVGRAFVVTTS